MLVGGSEMGKLKDSVPEQAPAEVLIEKIYAVSTLSAGEKEYVARAVDQVRLPPNGDRIVYRMVVGFLGSTALLTVLGSFVLLWHEVASQKIPTGLVALGAACVGALAGLLAPTPKG
jgi:hypothetical protein